MLVLRRIALICVVVLAWSGTAEAQPEGRKFGIGAQVGPTNGLSAKLYTDNFLELDNIISMESIDLLATWNLGDFLFLNGHVLTQHPIPGSPLHFFAGPGVLFGLDDDSIQWGASGNFGLLFVKQRFEIYLQVTPRLRFLPELDGEFGSGVGLRYFP